MYKLIIMMDNNAIQHFHLSDPTHVQNDHNDGL